MRKVFVLDTNIILDSPDNLVELSEDGLNEIIIPEIVIDELDNKKSGFDDINFNARQFARLLEESEIKRQDVINGIHIIETNIDSLNINIKIISKNNYVCEDKNIASNILNDRKILELTKEYNDNIDNVTFLSLDIMCRTRALSLGIITETLKGKNNEIGYDFHKELDVPDCSILNGKDITEIDPNYTNDNFSYTLKDSTGNQKLCQIQNNHIYYIIEKELEKQIIKPINKEQKFFVNAMIEGYADIIAIDAKAGSGKTLLSVATAMRLVKQKQYSKIIYVRNSIESLDKGEDVGYLPGLDEKFRIYNHPLMDSLEHVAKAELSKSKSNKSKGSSVPEIDIQERVEHYKAAYGVETMWVGEMRGRTISDAFVIIDEAQNMSAKTMQTVLSRIEKGCKVVVIGSNKQIDNFYINKYINGMNILLKSTKDKHEEVNLWAGELNKAVRGPITEWAERIYDRR